ncbi:MAG: lytic murein transglycosylase [Gammaproteobacteria bacterium]|nr:lytic murein transglycosylase [Gammaproteobacteria bacterium]
MTHHRTSTSFLTFCVALSLTACATDAPRNANPTANETALTSINQAVHSVAALTSDNPNPLSFEAWLTELMLEAKKQGLNDQTLEAIKPFLRLNAKVIELDQQQPEFTQTFWTYVDKRLSAIRVQAGKVQGYRYESVLKHIERTQGLPAEILVAFWGLETNYGTYLGSFNTLEALTTLAYDQRRSRFFRKELFAAMRIIEQGHIKPADMKGSWAGAVGQMQFMPSVFLKHATDADGDQKANLWASTEDALTSAAVYLQRSGWQAGQPWLQEVILPPSFDYGLADGKQTFKRDELVQLGIHLPTNQSWQGEAQDTVSLVLPAGYEGPAFVIWPNFNVIKRWNNSTNYALSVGLLAQKLSGQSGMSLKAPANTKPWPKTFMVQLQQTLTDRGYDTGGVDGWFGSKSTQALRQFQKANQLPADGYPNQATLQKLQLAP